MSIQIELKPEIEAELEARAEERGVPLTKYVQELVEQQVPLPPTPSSSMTPEERAKAFEEWANSFPPTPPLPDEALTRESFYRRDEE
ncbi:MAG TPA: hypothetical protein VKM93_15045 [Terriglobia bacterium]|nr:hypothetical protein [Terriglobia bacterium]